MGSHPKAKMKSVNFCTQKRPAHELCVYESAPFMVSTYSTVIPWFSWKTELEGISTYCLLIPSVKLCCPLDLYLFLFSVGFSSYTYHSEFFFQKPLPSKIFSSVGKFSEVLLTSSVRLLLCSASFIFNYKIFFSGFLLFFFLLLRLLLLLPILVELFVPDLLLTIFSIRICATPVSYL